MEELINKIENILNENIKFHSCNEPKCKFYYFFEFFDWNGLTQFIDWVDDEQIELINIQIKKILKLLNWKNKIYENMLKQIFHEEFLNNEWDDIDYEIFFEFPDDIIGTDAKKQYFIDYLKKTLQL